MEGTETWENQQCVHPMAAMMAIHSVCLQTPSNGASEGRKVTRAPTHHWLCDPVQALSLLAWFLSLPFHRISISILLISLWSKNYLSHSVLRCSPSQIPSGRWCPSHTIVWVRDSHPLSLVPMATRWAHFFCLLLIWAFHALSRSTTVSVLQPSLNQVTNSVPTEWSKLCLNV